MQKTRSMSVSTLSTYLCLGLLGLTLSGCGKQKKEKTTTIPIEQNQEKPIKKKKKKKLNKEDDLTLAELKQHAIDSIKRKRKMDAITYLEKIVTHYPDEPNIGKFKLMLAEMYFKTASYPSAKKMYSHFKHYYPASKHAEYAQYKSILSNFYQTLRTDCDQTRTEKTIKSCKKYLADASKLRYRRDVQDIQTTCINKLVDKEVYVFNYYLKQGELQAAENRLKHLRANFLEQNSSLEPRLLFLECKLEKKRNNKDSIRHKIEILDTKYPQSQFTVMAQSLDTSSSHKPTVLDLA
ncbi:MAG: outer membrane protein assembly factor BamD [Epsilonproteobacteria bacterium]|nr:outer membrane protein assembly factor BamD [Campylobacterota bacterium]